MKMVYLPQNQGEEYTREYLGLWMIGRDSVLRSVSDSLLFILLFKGIGSVMSSKEDCTRSTTCRAVNNYMSGGGKPWSNGERNGYG